MDLYSDQNSTFVFSMGQYHIPSDDFMNWNGPYYASVRLKNYELLILFAVNLWMNNLDSFYIVLNARRDPKLEHLIWQKLDKCTEGCLVKPEI